ncbi:hypothetical protein EJB05_46029 [Eragrostis curvula]|uniref:MCM N-terminal domain-containing protein n=1 Tax=Eragrostis curvula TaxID=38414 RepID=A0A5J9TND5_9POAL|nr:hypothetical protein EJB05_46029 [Eragrostis curvula]
MKPVIDLKPAPEQLARALSYRDSLRRSPPQVAVGMAGLPRAGRLPSSESSLRAGRLPSSESSLRTGRLPSSESSSRTGRLPAAERTPAPRPLGKSAAPHRPPRPISAASGVEAGLADRASANKVNEDGSPVDITLATTAPKPRIKAWSCLDFGLEEKEGNVDAITKLSGEGQVKYQIGTLSFSDRPSSTITAPKQCIKAWSCLHSGLEEKEGDVDAITKLSGEGQVKYQIGTLSFSDRPSSTLFYGQGFIDSVIKPSVPEVPTEERGSTTSYSRKPLYASVYSPECRARNSMLGHRFLQFLKGFKDASNQKIYYKGVVLAMISIDSPVMSVKFNHINRQDFDLAAEICYFYESIRQDLTNAAKSFILQCNTEFEAICSKTFKDFSNLTLCIDGLPEANRFYSLEALVELPGMHFSEPRTLCSGASSITVTDTTPVGRHIGYDLLVHLFETHAQKKTYNGRYNLRSIFVKIGSGVEIRAPYHPYSPDAELNDLIRYVDDFIPVFKSNGSLPAFFFNLGKSLKGYKPPILHFSDYVRRFRRFALTHLALRVSTKRVGLFSGLYAIRNTKHVRDALRAILKSTFGSDWRRHELLKKHPILKRVFNHKDAKEAGVHPNSKFLNTADGALKYVRHTIVHGPDGPEKDDRAVGESAEAGEVEEDPIQLLSDLELLCSHCMESCLPDILKDIIFAENIPHELEIMLKEVFDEYLSPEDPKKCFTMAG